MCSMTYCYSKFKFIYIRLYIIYTCMPVIVIIAIHFILARKLNALLPPKHLGVLGPDPRGVLLVNAGGAGQGPLGQRADGNQTTEDGVRILVTLGDGERERLVAVGGCLDWVVVVPGQHTRLELANHLGAFADGAHILCGN